MITMIELESAASTNSEMTARLSDLPHGAVVMAVEQTAGRGQRGNSWEAAPGLNVTMSLLLRDIPVEPRRQFVVSEAVALAVADSVASYLPEDTARQVAVKWPNDIYVADRKIAGILIECGIRANELTHAIAGIGLNVNQTRFVSDAPNPVSLLALNPAQGEYDVREIALDISWRILEAIETLPDAAGDIHTRYLARLWRREGAHRWRRRADGREFEASIEDVSPEGFLTLRDTATDTLHPPFAFKEVEAIL